MLKENAFTTVNEVVEAIKMSPHIDPAINWEDVDVIAQIERLINAYSADIEVLTNRKFGVAEYTEYLTGANQPSLVLTNMPIKSIKSIDLIDSMGNKVGELDAEAVYNTMGTNERLAGIIYLEPNFPQRFSKFGIVPERNISLRSMKIVYEAGFTLPKDATDGIPSDLPYDLENLVIEMAKLKFIKDTDARRSEDLIQLTEGNVQRNWGVPSKPQWNTDQKALIKRYRKRSL